MLEFLSPKAMTNNEQHVTLRNNKYRHMKSLFLSLFIVLLVSCNSDDTIPKDYTIENEQEIVDYIAEYDLNATATGSGLYYVIDEVGTGGFPSSSANVTVIYKGYYTNGNVFDPGNPDGISFGLNQVISGWTEGIPYFKKGSKGMLLIPAHLGYGSSNRNSIPGGSVLLFDIELKSIN
jgi:FKBP-type peptidyl-prolyl cis-trans isomerase FkpA